MSEATANPEAAAPAVEVAPSPHLSDASFTTRRMMLDVLIGLAPAMLASVVFFRGYAVFQIGLCVAACLGFEYLFTRMRGKQATLHDLSAVVTGVILGMSVPWSAPWYTTVIGAGVAIGLSKVMFGGLGYNMFNPAMVGRAFIMLSFARELGAGAYVKSGAAIDAITQATPLTAAKQAAGDLPGLWPLFVGDVNGSVGEVSALALLVGGIYLCWRRSASWEIPAGTLGAAFVWAALAYALKLTPLGPGEHLTSGALLLGAFFIATDPVTSPIAPKGKLIFGVGVGTFVMLLRIFSGYPEGVMFAVLLMNAATPVINRWTIPTPLGGPAPVRQ